MFLALLRVYLQPASGGSPLIEPALELLARHGSQINASEVSPPKEGWITKSGSIHTDMQEFFFLVMKRCYPRCLLKLTSRGFIHFLKSLSVKAIGFTMRI